MTVFAIYPEHSFLTGKSVRKCPYKISFNQNEDMITYDAFWKFTKENGISQYKLSEDYGLDHRLLDKLRHNKPIKTTTIDKLCQIFKITPN